MAWFKPTPIELKFGQPVHVLVARAYQEGALYVRGDSLSRTSYHFVGPHGIEYRGDLSWYERGASDIAALCEEIQQDFNERIAAMDKARAYARDQLCVPPLFASAKEPA